MQNNKKNSFYLIVLLCSFFIAMMACTTERNPCLEPTVAKLNVGCYQYKSDTKTYIDTALPNANFICLDIDSASRLYWGAKKISKFSLVLSPLKDTVRWTLQVDSSKSKTDTISFVYERKLKFYSTGCGYGYTYALSQVLATAQNLDSVRISNNEVTTKAGVENVKIFF